jgi:DMSO/TMAO reductase YedYZ molybdopterin-dependent catalytic subunit
VPSSLPAHPVPNGLRRSELGKLVVEGLVEKKLRFSLKELESMPSTKLTEDFRCLEGWEVKSVEWEGVSVRQLLLLARQTPEARCLVFESADGFTLSMDIEEAKKRNAIVAYKHWGRPIPFENGGPLRLVLVGHACYESLKWLVRITVLERCPEGTAKSLALKRLAARLS